jgi:hypothetical protein
MRTLLAVVALLAFPAVAAAATPVEGYHSADGREGCVMYQQFNSHGNAVKCGRRGSGKGLLLTSTGAARKQAWHWPAHQLGSLFFTAPENKTLYLTGGTAKLDGTKNDLRCTFKKALGVTCTNGDGYGVIVTRSSIRAVAPIR